MEANLATNKSTHESQASEKDQKLNETNIELKALEGAMYDKYQEIESLKSDLAKAEKEKKELKQKVDDANRGAKDREGEL